MVEAVAEAVADLVEGVGAADAGRQRHAVLDQFGRLVVVRLGPVLPTTGGDVTQRSVPPPTNTPPRFHHHRPGAEL